ncbi:hypothetical protein AB0C42_24095 [Micromonospora taraxaci]|uniref:hypothetical protein n=1 Tax=Micromonospora taraxaci TaxID=1316803 RepID=UPI0033C68F76
MWPDDGSSLPVEVAAAFGSDVSTNPVGWVWTDLSARIRSEITGRGGRSSGARNASPASYMVELDNDDGALTPLHPMSTYWPYVRLGTPVRFRVFWGGVWHTRILGSADAWEPTLRPLTDGTTASRVRLTVSGPLRRIEGGSDPRPSTPRRYIPTTNPVAYWPLEDGQLVSEGAAAVGGYAMRPFIGTHPSGSLITFSRWGRGDLAPWLPEVVSRAGNAGSTAIWAPVEGAALYTSTRWVVDFMYRSGTDAGSNTVDVNPSYLGGSLGWPQLYLDPIVRDVLVAMNGEPEVGGPVDTLFDGQPHHVRWDVYQNGAKVSWNVYVDAVQVNAGTTSGNLTLPIMQTISLVADAQQGADIAQGHLAVWAQTPPPLQDAVYAAFGYSGETAAARVARLCGEAGIPVTVGSGDSEPLGPQRPDTLIELLREAEAADMGVLYEDGVGLGYRPRGGRYNAAVDLTVDLATYCTSAGTGSEVLVPVYDDQSLRNRWTVSRPDGRSVTVEDTAHQARSGGIRPDSAELNLPNDTRLADHASWRLYLGTVDAIREASFPLDLAANPTLIAGWLALVAGARIVRQNPPAVFGPSPLDTFMDGWSERIGPRSWTVQVTPSPAGPWDVATADGDQRAPADGSTVGTGGLSSSAMSFPLTSTAANGVWGTDPADFPLTVRVGGEQMTLSGISGTSSPQTATVSARGLNNIQRAWPAGTEVDVWAPAISAL